MQALEVCVEKLSGQAGFSQMSASIQSANCLPGEFVHLNRALLGLQAASAAAGGELKARAFRSIDRLQQLAQHPLSESSLVHSPSTTASS